jgi:cytochrome c peroxidase
MTPVRAPPSLLNAFLGGVIAAALLLIGGSHAVESVATQGDVDAALLAGFRRPDGVPYPADNPLTPEKLALGARLFAETKLSRDGTVSCASCHDPALGLADGVPRGQGIAHERLPRHTPALWNLAWGAAFFWDGRAPTIEAQVREPIENRREMGETLPRVARKLSAEPAYRRAFAAAFPGDRAMRPDAIAAALATYVRSLVSPRTRFDAWVEGDRSALSRQEQAGFELFTGKAGCTNCHSGWAFTDRAFHDIGLPGDDLGRGKVIDLRAADHAFQTPSLRELAWTAPYMHDGSLASLDAVLDHYEHGVVRRPSVSPDIRGIALSSEERADLIAFLGTLSSDDPPRPAVLPASALVGRPGPPAEGTRVSQKDKQFMPGAIALHAGQSLTIENDDVRTHNVRLDTGPGPFNSGTQEPGQTVTLPFPVAGKYWLYCGIHPAMRLDVTVTR